MENETIDYEKLVKAKYPDAVLDYTDYDDYTMVYWVEIESIGFTSHEYVGCGKKIAWEQVHNELKQKNLL